MSSPPPAPPTTLDIALRLAAAGFSVVPIRADGSKAPTSKWKRFQKRIATPDEIHEMFRPGLGCGIITGKVSNMLEVLDLEAKAHFDEFAALVSEHAPELLKKLPLLASAGLGHHVYYRCEVCEGSQKLAMYPDTDGTGKTLIETRGEGGYVLTIGCPPACHISGRTYRLLSGRITETPFITPEERELLHSCSRSFNTYVKKEHIYVPKEYAAPTHGRKRPGDDYNERGDSLAVLKAHGWTFGYRSGDTVYLRRPGKDKKEGISASFGHVAPNFLYVFSSNALPFDFEHAYSPFSVYCLLEHNGDPHAAAQALARQGYGDRPDPKPNLGAEATKPADDPTKPIIEPVTDDDTTKMAALAANPTEDGVALFFQQQHAEKLRYCKPWGYWLEWDGTRWSPERTGLALDFARNLSRAVNYKEEKTPAKSSFAKGVETLASVSRTFATVPAQWDKDDHILNQPSGTFNLLNQTSRPHQKDDYVTRVCAVSAEPGPHPLFDQFMKDITLNDDALVQYLQRALGSILSGANREHWIMFWIGDGRNGKNTLGDLVRWIMGDYAKTISTQTLMSNGRGPQHPTDLAALRGIRLAVSSEVPEGSYWDEARIKSLTGDETIAARFMHQDFFEFRRTHKHVIYGNHRPMLRVVDDAMKARLHIVPFKAKFFEDACDPDMPAKLRTEARQILQWLIEGHALWLEDGRLKKCSAVEAETAQYFEAQSTPDMWLNECCELDFKASGAAGDLYKNFSAWKEARGEKPMSQTRWGEWMTARYGKTKSNGCIYYDGLRLTPNATSPNGDHSKRRWEPED